MYIQIYGVPDSRTTGAAPYTRRVAETTNYRRITLSFSVALIAVPLYTRVGVYTHLKSTPLSTRR